VGEVRRERWLDYFMRAKINGDNQSIHPAKPAGWRRVGAPGKSFTGEGGSDRGRGASLRGRR